MRDDEYGHDEPSYIPPAQEEPKLATWPNAPTVDALKADLTAAKSYHSAHTGEVADWIDQFNCTGKHAPIKRKGYSAVQPKVIRKQIEWRAAGLTEPLLSDMDLFKVRPRSYQDVQAALENSLVLNYQFQNQIDKVSFLDSYVRTAITEGTVIVKVLWNAEWGTKLVEEDKEIFMTTEESFMHIMNMVQNINRIKVMLAEKNKSNKWLAEQLQKDPATVSKWCTNKLQPGLQTLLEIANLLEVDIKELLNSSREDVTYIQINK